MAFTASVAAEPPPLPPGVQLIALEDIARPPIGYAAEWIEVDWTHPLLRVEAIDGLPADRGVPIEWTKSLTDAPDALQIQLIEPVEPTDVDERWRLALPMTLSGSVGAGSVGPPPSALMEAPPEDNGIVVGSSYLPWNPIGPALERMPEWNSPLPPDGARLGVRWLGRARDLDRTTTTTWPARCLFSVFSPETGRTRFGLVVHEQGGLIRLGDLVVWLKSLVTTREWLAIHSVSHQAIVGIDAFRLTVPPHPRRVERVGGAIRLRGLRAGDPVDWLRLKGCKITASTYQRDFPPQNLVTGLLWPNPLDPSVWINRPSSEGHDAPWIEVEFATSRPIDRVSIIWPNAAGWSSGFNPGHAVLVITPEIGGRPERIDLRAPDRPDRSSPHTPSAPGRSNILAPDEPVYTWTSTQPLAIHRIRLEFPESTHDPLDPIARLTAIQAWGPWNGELK